MENTREQIKPYIFRNWYIPPQGMESIHAYLIDGRRSGSFLAAIFANDFVHACGQADDENLKNIPAYAAFLYNEAPSLSWGSRKRVNDWIKKQTSKKG